MPSSLAWPLATSPSTLCILVEGHPCSQELPQQWKGSLGMGIAPIMDQKLSEPWVEVIWQAGAAQQPVIATGMKEARQHNHKCTAEVNDNTGTEFTTGAPQMAASESPLSWGDSFLDHFLGVPFSFSFSTVSLWLQTLIPRRHFGFPLEKDAACSTAWVYGSWQGQQERALQCSWHSRKPPKHHISLNLPVYIYPLGLNPGGEAGSKPRVPLQSYTFLPKYGPVQGEAAICQLNGVNTNF